MDRLPDDVMCEVLACLRAREVESLLAASKTVSFQLRRIGCVPCASVYRKAVSPKDLAAKYASHAAFDRVPGSKGVVTLKPLVVAYRDRPGCKLVLQGLELVGEHDAAGWLATSVLGAGTGAGTGAHYEKPSTRLLLARDLAWDFGLFSFTCQALEQACKANPAIPLALHVRSVPIMATHNRSLETSAQPFLVCLLTHAAACEAISLQLQGVRHPGWFVWDLISEQEVEEERRLVDAVVSQEHWTSAVGWDGLHRFRSTTLGLGVVLMTAKPRLRRLDLFQYTFDEPAPSLDVRLLCQYLRLHTQQLARVHLHGIFFRHGADCVAVLTALLQVATLRSLRLSSVDYAAPVPMDPLLVLFQAPAQPGGAHIQDLRLNNVMRPIGEAIPFDAMVAARPAYRYLGLTRMFLDTARARPLLVGLPSLPHLLSLDLSYNGMDGGCLGLLAIALQHPACKLKRLKLTSNIITATAIDDFCDALARNQQLQHLDLADNVVGTDGGMKLLRAIIHQNRGLQYVRLDKNHIRTTVEDLYRVLLHGPGTQSFLQLSLRDNFINGLAHPHNPHNNAAEHDHVTTTTTTANNTRAGAAMYTAFFAKTFHVKFYF
jgi:hypothetical protein